MNLLRYTRVIAGSLLLTALLLGLIVVLASPTDAQFWPVRPLGAVTPPVASGCSQATTFLARTSGLNSTYQSAYTNLICGLVTDGVITGNLSTTGCGAPFDALYVFASEDGTNALLNLCSSNYNATAVASPTFTSASGYAGVATGSGIDSGFTPSTASSPNYIQNSAHIAFWSLTDQETVNSQGVFLGSSVSAQVFPRYTDGNVYCDVNDTQATGDRVIESTPDSLGLYVCDRTSSSTLSIYKGTTLLGTASASTSSVVPDVDIYFAATNNVGVIDADPRIIAMASIGADITAAIPSIHTRFCAYLTAIGSPGAC